MTVDKRPTHASLHPSGWKRIRACAVSPDEPRGSTNEVISPQTIYEMTLGQRSRSRLRWRKRYAPQQGRPALCISRPEFQQNAAFRASRKCLNRSLHPIPFKIICLLPHKCPRQKALTIRDEDAPNRSPTSSTYYRRFRRGVLSLFFRSRHTSSVVCPLSSAAVITQGEDVILGSRQFESHLRNIWCEHIGGTSYCVWLNHEDCNPQKRRNTAESLIC